jgi:O-ureido-D-serine cyclo-ligase
MRAPRVALVTARDALAIDGDLPPLREALAALGAEVALPIVDWARFDIAVLRSTWDYPERIDEFLAWIERCASLTRLENPLATVRWNTDKRYLLELARAGVPVVPTRFVAPEADAAYELERFIAGETSARTLAVERGFSDFVVKPVVGVGSRDVGRYSRSDLIAAQGHLARLLGAGRHAMLQPYLDRVDEHGETAVIFFAGTLSHSVHKGPLLKPGARGVSTLFVAPETITPQVIAQAEREVALAAVRAVPFGIPLYARVDLVRDQDDAPVVLELELTEPSLFFAHGVGSAHRLATAIIACVRS